MSDAPAFRAQDVVCVTSEDDAVDDLSIRMRHARTMLDALSSPDPSSLLVHPGGDGAYLLVRPHDAQNGLTIGTTLARRFRPDDLTPGSVATLLEVVLIALNRYGTIDQRQEQHDLRFDAVIDCVFHDHAFLHPQTVPEQILLAAPCPWSTAASQVGGWTQDGWHEPDMELPEGTQDFLPSSVTTSIDADGRIRIGASTVVRLQDAIRSRGIVDGMTRLRLQSAILRSDRFECRPMPGMG